MFLRAKKALIISTSALLLLGACSSPEATTKKKESKIDQNTVVTDDQKVTFKLVNRAHLSTKQVDNVKKKLHEGYNVIRHFTDTGYTPKANIMVMLNPNSNNPSFGGKNFIRLENADRGTYELIHEMTHTLLGYDDDKGYMTQEGLATYMENQYGDLKLSVDQFVRYFIKMHARIPLSRLTDEKVASSYFRPLLDAPENVTLRQMSYVEAGSFATYLLDVYGREKFTRVYNQSPLNEKLKEVYGKDVAQLENEWLAEVAKTPELTEEEADRYPFLQNISSSLQKLEPELFAKDR